MQGYTKEEIAGETSRFNGAHSIIISRTGATIYTNIAEIVIAEDVPFETERSPSIDRDTSVSFWKDGGYDKEVFYETDADVHFLDPNEIQYWDDSWDDDDIAEIFQAVGPICGNNCRRRRDFRNELDYPLFSLFEAFEKVAQVFQVKDRYEALTAIHDDVLAEVTSRLPPEGERTKIA